MAKYKNFKINRNKEVKGLLASDVKIGDVFERNGSLHMRVEHCSVNTPSGSITLCNLNTGSVWCVDSTERLIEVTDCEINYNINENSYRS